MTLQNILLDLFVLALFGAAIYAFLVLPRQRDFRKRQKFVAQLEPGARVVTYGGIVGTVKRVDAAQGLTTLEIADGVEVLIVSAAVMSEFDAEGVSESTQKALKG